MQWTTCKQSASRFRQITTPTPHRSIFTGRVLFLTPNQQCRSTEGNAEVNVKLRKSVPLTWLIKCGLEFETIDLSVHSPAVRVDVQAPARDFYRAMLCIRGTSHEPVSVLVCVCPCLSQAGVLLKRQNVGSHIQHHTIPPGLVFCCQRSPRNSTGSPPTRAPNAGGVV